MKLIDTHAHILKEYYPDDYDSIVDRIEKEMEYIINIGLDLNSSQEVVELSKKTQNILSAIGIHPSNVNKKEDIRKDLNSIEKMLSNDKVIAIGEIGLDYHYENSSEIKKIQKEAFINQIEIAINNSLPIIIHTRDSIDDTLDIIENYPMQKFLLHSWSGDVFQTKRALEMNNVIFGINGIVTFKNAKLLNDVLKIIPINKILLETDCPYLSPTPLRGKTNNPFNTIYILEHIAKAKKIKKDLLLRIIKDTSNRFFSLNYET